MYYNKFALFQMKDDDIKGFTDYTQNKELMMYILTRRIVNGIIKHVNKIDISDTPIEYQQKLIETIKNSKKIDDNDLNSLEGKNSNDKKENTYESLKKDENDNPSENITKEQIELISKINSHHFSSYFQNYKYFWEEIKKNFSIRFKDIQKLENEDLDLFIEFCFFLECYNFESESLYFYIGKWNDTFSQPRKFIEFFLEQNSVINRKIYKLINNDLFMELFNHNQKKKEIFIIKNIDKYSINCIYSYLNGKSLLTANSQDNTNSNDYSNYTEYPTIIDEYRIEKYLKFDSKEDIYINKIWNIFEEHLITIFTSVTMKDALRQLFKDLNLDKDKCYDFLNEDDLKKFFKRTRFFEFQSDILGLTEPSFFINFIYYKGLINSYKDKFSKLFNLCLYQILQEHEILGHINIRLQDYISEQEIKSPKVKRVDKTRENKIYEEAESGDFLESILYGECIYQLSINQILFLLDAENYKVSVDVFRTNFKNCENGNYNISEYLATFLKKLKISINQEFYSYAPVKLNREGLVGKIVTHDNIHFYFKRHPPLHRKKDDYISLQNIIDKYFLKK